MWEGLGVELELVSIKEKKTGHSVRNSLRNGVSRVWPGKDGFLSRAIGSRPGRPGISYQGDIYTKGDLGNCPLNLESSFRSDSFLVDCRNRCMTDPALGSKFYDFDFFLASALDIYRFSLPPCFSSVKKTPNFFSRAIPYPLSDCVPQVGLTLLSVPGVSTWPRHDQWEHLVSLATVTSPERKDEPNCPNENPHWSIPSANEMEFKSRNWLSCHHKGKVCLRMKPVQRRADGEHQVWTGAPGPMCLKLVFPRAF